MTKVDVDIINKQIQELIDEAQCIRAFADEVYCTQQIGEELAGSFKGQCRIWAKKCNEIINTAKLRAPWNTISEEKLMEKLSDNKIEGFDKAIDKYIAQLRSLLNQMKYIEM